MEPVAKIPPWWDNQKGGEEESKKGGRDRCAPSREALIVHENSLRGQPVMLLTGPPKRNIDRAEFEVLARKLNADQPEIQIRYAPPQILHDRFIVTRTEA